MSGRKMFLIVSGAVACGITLAIIAYTIFFAAAASVLSVRATNSQREAQDSETKPALSKTDEAFLEAVENGDIDSVRTSLVGKLNWQQVATPALSSLVSFQNRRLRHTKDESDQHCQDSEFWTKVADLLHKNGADATAALADANDLTSLEYLVAHGANAKADEGRLLRLADCKNSDLYEEQVIFFISKGANVNSVDDKGNTPLHEAAMNNSVQEINSLLSAGAAVNAKNKNGQTPLAIADLAIQKDAAVLLKSRGGSE